VYPSFGFWTRSSISINFIQGCYRQRIACSGSDSQFTIEPHWYVPVEATYNRYWLIMQKEGTWHCSTPKRISTRNPTPASVFCPFPNTGDLTCRYAGRDSFHHQAKYNSKPTCGRTVVDKWTLDIGNLFMMNCDQRERNVHRGRRFLVKVSHGSYTSVGFLHGSEHKN